MENPFQSKKKPMAEKRSGDTVDQSRRHLLKKTAVVAGGAGLIMGGVSMKDTPAPIPGNETVDISAENEEEMTVEKESIQSFHEQIEKHGKVTSLESARQASYDYFHERFSPKESENGELCEYDVITKNMEDLSLFMEEFDYVATGLDTKDSDKTWLYALAAGESLFDVDAVSPAGAAGICQLMDDGKYDTLGIKMIIEEGYDERKDPIYAANAAVAVFNDNKFRAADNFDLALIGYNGHWKDCIRPYVLSVANEADVSLEGYNEWLTHKINEELAYFEETLSASGATTEEITQAKLAHFNDNYKENFDYHQKISAIRKVFEENETLPEVGKEIPLYTEYELEQQPIVVESYEIKSGDSASAIAAEILAKHPKIASGPYAMGRKILLENNLQEDTLPVGKKIHISLARTEGMTVAEIAKKHKKNVVDIRKENPCISGDGIPKNGRYRSVYGKLNETQRVA